MTTATYLAKVADKLGVQPAVRDLLIEQAGLVAVAEAALDVVEANQALIQAAIQGDIVLDISPETVAPVPTAAAWTRTVTLTLKNAAGDTHTWCDMAFAASAAIEDDSTAGTATIVSTTVTFVNGVCSIVVSGDAAAWLDSETDTLTISNLTIMGYTVTGGTSVETFTAA